MNIISLVNRMLPCINIQHSLTDYMINRKTFGQQMIVFPIIMLSLKYSLIVELISSIYDNSSLNLEKNQVTITFTKVE